ncbi:MAG TPA: M23 family metallopeptidase [Balneolales bacterium]|nr:M23 family metallopeptidase [Balneolales bacterium]
MTDNSVLLLIIQIIIPLSIILWFVLKRMNSQVGLLLDVILTVFITGFIIISGRWDIYSIYFQYVIVFIFIIGLLYRIRLFAELDTLPDNDLVSWFLLLGKLIVIVIFGMLNYQIYQGYQFNNDVLNISFPLKNGDYYITEGGNNRILNKYINRKGEHYASDIVKLDFWGMGSQKFNPNSLSDYNIYADTVYSPVDGRIVDVIDTLNNGSPGKKDLNNHLGNYVVIEYLNNLIILSNLKKNSVLVPSDMYVTTGQPIAQVGNTEKGLEPSLHFFAIRGTDVNNITNGYGLPIMTDNDYLIKNSVIHR